MSRKFIFVTGTGTGVGKTVFATLLVRKLRCLGVRVVGLKPVCSGDRQDALRLWKAGGKVLALDEVNPWHFRAPLAPVVAARQEGMRLRKTEVLRPVRAAAKDFERVVVEGAGGLLSPMGEGFDSRDLIESLDAMPIVVSENKLGAVNQVRLVLEALPGASRARAQVVLFESRKRDPSAKSNPALLAEYCPLDRICVLPWIGSEAGERTFRGEWIRKFRP